MPGQLENVQRRLSGTPLRIQNAAQSTSRFGPYDYVFIDAPLSDEPIDFILASLLDVLEAQAAFVREIDPLLGGVRVCVSSSDPTYAEEIDATTFERLARLKLRVTFAFEHTTGGPASSSAST